MGDMVGIVLTPKVVISPQEAIIKSNIINDEFVRCLSLYFSEFATFSIGGGFVPLIPFPISPALSELIAAGQVRCLSDCSDNGAKINLAAYPHSTVHMDNLVSGVNLSGVASEVRNLARSAVLSDWYLSPDLIELCAGGGRRLPTVDFSILGKLCTPDPGTPIEEILKFREKREPELRAFWDSMTTTVESSDIDDNNGRIVLDIENLEKRLLVLTKALDAPWLSRVIESMEIKIMFDKFTQGAILASAAGLSQGMGWAMAVVTTAAGFVRPKIDFTPPIQRVRVRTQSGA